MSTRAHDLARQFAQANQELIDATTRCSAAGWRARCDDTGWTVATTVRHLTRSHEGIRQAIQLIIAGQETGLTMAAIDVGNAQRAEADAQAGQAEALDQLRRAGASVATWIGGLSEADLATQGVFLDVMPPMTVAQIIEGVSIGHVRDHLTGLRAAANV